MVAMDDCTASTIAFLLLALCMQQVTYGAAATALPSTVEQWRLGLQRWDFADNCTGSDDGRCEPSWKNMTKDDWRIHGLWPGPSDSSVPPQPETLDCDPGSNLNTSEAWLTAALTAHRYQNLLNSWVAHNQVRMDHANIHKADGALSARAEDIWMHEWSKHGTCACHEKLSAHKGQPKRTMCSHADQVRFINAVLALYDHMLGSTNVLADCCTADLFDCEFHVGIDTSTLRWATIPGTHAIYACIEKTWGSIDAAERKTVEAMV
jgi:hypothetical protein